MKISKLIIKNIGKIAEETITLDKALILFYGEIRQGKSTILNCVRWVCGGEFPQDIIHHGQKEAFVEMQFDGGMIRREWYKAKDESTKARSVVFVRGGRPVASPVAEIKRFLNPFLIDQDFLRNKSEIERKQYFTELFAVDTTELDTEFFNLQREAQQLRAKVNGYGEIDLTPVESVDVSALKSVLNEVREAHSRQYNAVQAGNNVIREGNSFAERATEKKAGIQSEIEAHEKKLAELREMLAACVVPAKVALVELPEPADTSELESKIQNGAAQNVRAEQFATNKKRSKLKADDESSLAENEKRQREIKAAKQAALKTLSDKCGIAGLEFDEAGNFIYQGTTAGMISDSQIMRLSSELSALYPDGFGLDLIDRGESLGKSIFEFVDKAKKEEKTILATIVGERPAHVPENVGVFVVNDGKLSK